MVGVAGWLVFLVAPGKEFCIAPLSLYIGALVVWTVWRVGKVYEAFDPFTWPAVATDLGIITMFFEPAIGVINPAPEFTRIAFGGVWRAILLLSLASFAVQITRYWGRCVIGQRVLATDEERQGSPRKKERK
jgi:hypothetical protein